MQIESVVTGATGLIGTAIIQELESRGISDNFAISKSESTYKHNQINHVNLLNFGEVNEFMTKYSPKYIFHTAANSSVIDSYNYPLETIEYNCRITDNLISSIRQNSLQTKLIFLSSSAVYARKDSPISEDDLLGPDSPYGMSKLISEMEMENLKSSLILRPFFIIGKGKKGDVLDDWITQIKTFKLGQKNYLKTGNLNIVRDYVPVRIAANAIVELGLNTTGILNIGSGKGTRLSNIVEYLREASDREFEAIQESPEKMRNRDRMYVVADTKRLEFELGDSLITDLKSEILQIYSASKMNE